MLSHRSAMVTTLTALRARQGDLATELADLERRVAKLRAEEADLHAAITALQRLVGEEDAAADSSNAGAVDVAAPALTEDDRDVSPFIHDEELNRDEPPRRKKVRSTQMVKDHLMFVAQPQTREEILEYFRARGITANWKNPVNAVNSALIRAVSSGQVHELEGGRFVHISAPATTSPSSPVSGAPSDTEEQ